MKFIKIHDDKYLIAGSNHKIVSSKEILEMDEEKCPKNKKKNNCKDCEPKADKEGILIDEESVKAEDNK